MSNTFAAYNFFDTHAFVKELEGVGFSEEQAELLSRKQAESVEHKLATKQDILGLKKDILNLKKDILDSESSLRKDMKASESSLKKDMKDSESSLKKEMKALEVSLKRDIQEMSYKLTIRMGGMFVAMIGILSAIKFFG